MLKYLVTAAVFASCQPALAQDQTCGQFDAAVKYLADVHGEGPTARGLSSQGVMLVIFTNPDTETYTVLMVRSDGLACIVDDGEGFESFSPIIGDPT